MSDPVCVNAHDRCYEGGPCPLCEPAPSWQQKMKDTIATLTAERDAWEATWREEVAENHRRADEIMALRARAARLEEALRAADYLLDRLHAVQRKTAVRDLEEAYSAYGAARRAALAQETQG
jgi:hypothetical protein